MSLAPGARLGPYEIVASLGAGGMGEVWKARDTRLGREVALKLLPPTFAADSERAARFEREAKLLAALDHPHIAHVYGFEESDGVHALVMELVEGEDLAARIARGPVPPDEAAEIARQIAEALEAAHEQGIVHRDLKPANVKVRADGTVKVLDFGLAKAVEVAPAPPADLAHSPTLSAHATELGVILGTAAYMAPEQARGKPVDKRADIWAFGVVLWEMLAGRHLFAGETVFDTISAVLRQEIDWSPLPEETPPRLRRLLARCLERDPKQRLRDIGEARIELTAEESTSAVAPPSSARPRALRKALAWGLALTALVNVAVWSALAAGRRPAPARRFALAVLPPPGTVSSGPIDLSRDGRQLAFTATGTDGRSRLYVRSLDSVVARALAGTEGAYAPFFSPDGRALGFFADGKLKRIDLAGGPPRELADAPDLRGGSWGADDVIVFAAEGGSPILRVAASGGPIRPVTALDASTAETSHRWPHFLPDGRHFFFMNRRPQRPGRLAVEVASIDGGRRVRLAEADSSGAFARGRLFFLRGTTLFAQSFDGHALTLSGEPVALSEEAWRDPGTDGLSAFAVAEDGTLAYRRGGMALSQLTWLDRQGRELGTVGPRGPGLGSGGIALSADGRRVFFDMAPPQKANAGAIFALELATGRTTRMTFGPGNEQSAHDSPDGRFLIFASDARGSFDLYRQEIGTAGEPSPLLVNARWKFPESWSPDGRFLSFRQSTGHAADLWLLSLAGDAKATALAQTPADEAGSAFSPDGRFFAYVSDESGRAEVYVRTFPPSAVRCPISASGGAMPVWRRDGKELFYLDADGWLVVVPVALAPGRFEAGAPRRLFPLPRLPSLAIPANGSSYTVSADGERILADLVVDQPESSPIVIRSGDGP